MRILIGSVIATFVIIGVAIVAIPFLVSTDWIRDQVIATVNEKTGRTLTIAGGTSLSVFPDLSLTVGKVAFSNPAGRAGDLVAMEELDVGLKLLPLLGGGVEVDRLILTRPVFNLEVDANGQRNWSFKNGEEGAGTAAAASAPAEPRESSGSALPTIEAVQLGDVRIVEGTFSYRDQRSDTFHQATGINATLELPSLSDPMKLSGTLVWQAEEVSFSTEVTEPQALTTGTPTAMSISLDSAQLKLGLNGNLAIKDGFGLQGNLETSTPSVKALVRWLGGEVPDVAGLEAFSIKAGIKADETGIALDNVSLSLDDITAEGGLLVSLGGAKPVIRATLAASLINLGIYTGGKPSGGAADSGGQSAGKNAPAASPNSGWSDEPIDLSALRAVDADMRISAAGLVLGQVEIGQSALAVTLKDAVLSVDLSELQLYDGRAAGRLTVNGASETPAIAAAFNIDNVSANPLLAALAGFDWIEGRARIIGSLASRGTSQRGLVQALNGEARMLFADGAVRGINIAQMTRNIQLGNIAGWAEGGDQKTDFSEFSASFTITRGIAQTSDIKLLSPLVRVSGGGVADIPNRTLDFRIVPKIVASIEGQGGSGDLAGLEIPVLIRGQWSRPNFAPDVEGLLSDPSKVIDAAKNIGKAIEGALGDNPKKALKDALRNPGDFLKQLSGGNQGNGQQPAPMEEDVFKRLLGQ